MSSENNNALSPDVSTRYLCDILEDMRKCYKTRNFSYLPGLIEELQYRANRMENSLEKLSGYGGLRQLEQNRITTKERIAELEKERSELEKKIAELSMEKFELEQKELSRDQS